MRGVSFGADAERYHALRPGYPPGLVDALNVDGPGLALDVGCGTGLAAQPLLEHGWTVVGVEADGRMAAVARAQGVSVETCRFEEWEPRARIFDLVICAQAWWWLDRSVALSKIAQVLRPGGRVAIFWNAGACEDGLTHALREVYAEIGGDEIREPMMIPDGLFPDAVGELAEDDRFGAVATATYESTRRYTAEHWVGAAATFGDVIALPAHQRDRLLDTIGETVEAHGGFRDVHLATSLVTAIRL